MTNNYKTSNTGTSLNLESTSQSVAAVCQSGMKTTNLAGATVMNLHFQFLRGTVCPRRVRHILGRCDQRCPERARGQQ